MPQHIEFVYDVDPKNQGFFWPASEQKRIDYFAVKRLRPAEAESVYQCRPGARVGSIFVDTDFRYYDPPAGLEAGLRDPGIRSWIERSGGFAIQGWDTAITASSQSDYTAGFTALAVPCFEYHRDEDPAVVGPCDTHYDIYVLNMYREKVEIGDLITAIRENYQIWMPRIVLIEKRANGTPAMQALANSNIPMEGVNPTENKRDRAVNGGAGAGSVQGWFRAGRVLFPRYASELDNQIFLPWLAPFTRELKDFTGEKGGRDDQVDAMVHAIGWAIREGGAGNEFPTEWSRTVDVDRQMMGHNGGPAMNPLGITTPADAFAHLAAVEADAFDVGRLLEKGIINSPFEGHCGTCLSFKNNVCQRHRMAVSAIHPGCDYYDDGMNSLIFPAR